YPICSSALVGEKRARVAFVRKRALGNRCVASIYYWMGFTSSYFAHPAEIRPLLKRNGFEDLDLIGCEGAVSMIEEKINELKGDEFDSWVDLNYRLGKDMSLHGAAEHLLYVGRKHLKESSGNK